MVKLRLRRRGRKKRPFYEIVATDSRKSRDGEFLERIGRYNPMTKPSEISVDKDRALHWLKNGAQPTSMVRHILSVEGVMLNLHLERKGKSAEEIAEALERHASTVQARLDRMASKAATKKAEAEAAKQAEADAAAAEAAAEAAEEATEEAATEE